MLQISTVHNYVQIKKILINLIIAQVLIVVSILRLYFQFRENTNE